MNISNSVFTNNYALKNGGAIYSSGNMDIRISNTKFNSNIALS